MLASIHPLQSGRDACIVRARLLNRLSQGLQVDLTLVSAPAGYGKTTLVASWLRSVAPPAHLDCADGDGPAAAWCAIEASDDVLELFVSSFVAALRRAVPDACLRTLHALSQPALSSADQIAALLIADCAALSRDLIVVLDDLHHIVNPEIHRLLARLVRHSRPTLHWVVVTRSDPPWGIARMRAEGRLMELRAQDLQFTRDEAAQLLCAQGHAHDPLVVDVLYQRTEGWAVGLKLALAGLHAHDNPALFLRGFEKSGSRFLLDYLADEVLEPQSDAVQHFLLHTAILDRFSVALCAAVLGDGNEAACHRIIRYLVDHNLFILPLDDHGTWYRYHPEFRSLLLMRGLCAPDRQNALHLRAGKWMADAGFIDEALAHFRAARNFDAAVAVIEGALPQVFNEGLWLELDRWLRQLPASIVFRRPLLILAQCARQISLHRTGAFVAYLEQAEALIAEQSGVETAEAKDAAQGLLAALRCATAADGTQAEAIQEQAQRALHLLPPAWEWPRGLVYESVAIQWVHYGRAADAEALARRELGRLLPHQSTLRRRLEAVLWWIQHETAAVDEARRSASRYLTAAEAAGAEPDLTLARYAMAAALYEQAGWSAAREYLELVVLSPRPIFHGVTYLLSLGLLLPIYARMGEPERGLAVMAGVRRREETGELVGLGDQVDALAALATSLAGDHLSARAWAARTGIGPNDLFDDQHSLILVRILLADGSAAALTRAGDVLGLLLGRRQVEHSVRQQVTAGALLASVLWAQGKKPRALEALEQAIALAGPRGYHMAFAEAGSAMSAMLRELAARGKCVAEASALLDRIGELSNFQSVAEGRVFGGDGAAVEALTDRERVVLRALSRGLSNKEIAREMGLSAYTVRFHASNVYAKLQVNTRGQAVERARELALLPRSRGTNPFEPSRQKRGERTTLPSRKRT